MATTTKKATWADASDSDGEDIPQVARAAAPAPQAPSHAPREAPASRREEPPRRAPTQINPNGPFILFVGNLSYDVKVDDLGVFFHNGGCRVKNVNIPTDRTSGKPKGFAHVEMEDRASLEKALTANNVAFMGRNLNVDVGNPVARREERERRGDFQGGGGRDSRDGPVGADRKGGRRNTDRAEHAGSGSGERREPKAWASKTPVPPAAEAVTAAPAPAERKKLNLLPRSLPMDTSAAATPSSYNSIFGEAKPRDETAIEKEKTGLPQVPPSTSEEVEKKVADIKISPPAPPTTGDDKKDASFAVDKKTGYKDRVPKERPLKPDRGARPGDAGKPPAARTDAEKPKRDGIGRGSARGDGGGRGRGETSGRGRGTEGRGNSGRSATEQKTKAPKVDRKKAVEATDDGPGDTSAIHTLTDHVDAAAESRRTTVPVKTGDGNIYAAIMDQSDSEED